MIYHRWGGLGSHRYQLGFSGDTYDTWDVLAFLPYFTATASNVGYGYWGHDIGGHMQMVKRPTEAEMMTRWIQYGVFTPIFKTHSNNSSRMERRIWAFPNHYEYMKDAIELRYALSPYIYDMARKAYDDEYAVTEFRKRSTGSSCVIEIGARNGTFDRMSDQRCFTVVLGGLTRKPSSVMLDDKTAVPCIYNQAIKEAVFTLPPLASEQSCKVSIIY